MSELITNNIYPQQQNLTVPQQSTAQNENFGAVDLNAVKEDTVQLAQKTGDDIKNENWLFRTLRNTFGVKDPKKLLISVGLTLMTVIGCAYLGNKMSDKTAEFGLKVDEKILGKDGKSIWARIGKSLSSAKSNAIKWARKHSKTIDDLADTFQNKMAKPKSNMTRGYGRGFVSIFSLTPVDILEKAFKGDIAAFKKAAGDTAAQDKIVARIKEQLTKLVGSDAADTFAKQILGTAEKMDNREACSLFSKALSKNFGCTSKKDFLALLKKIKAGEIDGSQIFTKVEMIDRNPICSWWPVNITRKITRIFNKNSKIGLGNLGDSLIKFNAVNGTLADTKLGSLAQKSIIVPTESISNFVNDKSGLGVLLCGSILSTYNNAQDAPKGKKVGTVADDFVGTIGSLAIATPLAFKTTYGLASLNNVEGKTFITKALKKIGGIFNMGLKDGSKFLPRKLGGVLRFALIMFGFSAMFSKPIKKVIHKIFGEPYDPSAEKKNEEASQSAQNTPSSDSSTVAPQTNLENNNNLNQSSTNLIDKYTTNPVNSQSLPVDAQQQNAQQPIFPAQPVQPVASNPIIDNNLPAEQTDSDAIPASKLNKGKNNGRYIPSIEVSYTEPKKNEEVDPQVEALLKKADLVMDSVNKSMS